MNCAFPIDICPISIRTGFLLLSVSDFSIGELTGTLPKLSVLGAIRILPNLPTPRSGTLTIGLVALLFTIRFPMRVPT